MLSIISMMSIAGCAKSIPPNSAGSSVQCVSDCAVVTKGLLIEHADLFDEVIRLRLAVQKCQDQK